jgi:hypothetical protein
VTGLDSAIAPALLHGGFLLFLTAYILRDILWLRLVTALAYVLFSVLAVYRGGMAVIELLPWYVAFVTINALQVGRLAHERWLVRLAEEERALWESAFHALDPVVFKRFVRLGEWRTLSDGFVLATEGRRGLRFYLVAEGRVEVTLRGRVVARLGPGQFVGEIGFIAHRRATATAVARTDADGRRPRCVVWNVPKLREQMEKDPDLRSLVYAAVGSDLAHKIAIQNDGGPGRDPDVRLAAAATEEGTAALVPREERPAGAATATPASDVVRGEAPRGEDDGPAAPPAGDGGAPRVTNA